VRKEKAEKALSDALNQAKVDYAKLQTVYSGQLAGLKDELDKCQKAKETLITDNTTLSTTVQTQKDRIALLQQGQASVGGFSELLPMFWTVLLGKFKKKGVTQ